MDWDLIQNIAILSLIIYNLYVLYSSMPHHKHRWRAVNVSYYDSITGPRTIIGWRCDDCLETDESNKRGEWKLENLQ